MPKGRLITNLTTARLAGAFTRWDTTTSVLPAGSNGTRTLFLTHQSYQTYVGSIQLEQLHTSPWSRKPHPAIFLQKHPTKPTLRIVLLHTTILTSSSSHLAIGFPQTLSSIRFGSAPKRSSSAGSDSRFCARLRLSSAGVEAPSPGDSTLSPLSSRRSFRRLPRPLRTEGGPS